MFKAVLVSIDGSAPSDRALALAIDVAGRYRARLAIVHAVVGDISLGALMETAKRQGFLGDIVAELDEAMTGPAFPTPITAPPRGTAPTVLLERFGALLLEAASARARELGVERVETALLGEDVAREVLQFVAAKSIDLIVCGTRGQGDIKSFFLGSVSRELLEEAKCPCLVVK